MKLLNRLTPAENWMLLHGTRATRIELLKFTFLDLVIREVISVSKTTCKAGYADPESEMLNASQGPAYKLTTLKAHEQVFTTPLKKMGAGKILMRHLLKIGYRYSVSKRYLHSLILRSKELKGNFRQNWFQKLTGSFSYTDFGLKNQELCDNEISGVKKQLDENPGKQSMLFRNLVPSIWGNLFLVDDFDLGFLTDVEKLLMTDMKKMYMSWTQGTSADGCGGGFEYFDNHHSDGCGGSGCGGSGCSGCSGCGGGCGGCGGCGS